MATAFEQKRSRKPRILVVDDSQIARYVLSDMLERFGLEVEVADSAETGLQKIREARSGEAFAAVFMDYMLPGIDGLEAVKRLRSREATMSLPVVMYTSEDSLEFRNRAGDAGATDVFVKTARQETLHGILARLGVIAADSPKTPPVGNVIPMHGGTAGRTGTADPTGMKLLSRSLEAHHAALRSDLLAEFAILERHEEKMRSELATRVNLVARHTVALLRKSAEQTRKERAVDRRNAVRRAWAHAAMFAIAVILALGLGWKAIENYAAVDSQLAAATAAVQSQARMIETLRADLLAATALRDSANAPAQAPVVRRPVPTPRAPSTAASQSAAAALVGELQSMGIMGRIRVETDAGTFCIGAAQGDYRLQGGNLSFNQCEPLPIAPQTTP